MPQTDLPPGRSGTPLLRCYTRAQPQIIFNDHVRIAYDFFNEASIPPESLSNTSKHHLRDSRSRPSPAMHRTQLPTPQRKNIAMEMPCFLKKETHASNARMVPSKKLGAKIQPQPVQVHTTRTFGPSSKINGKECAFRILHKLLMSGSSRCT